VYVLGGTVNHGLGNLLAPEINISRPGHGRSHTLTARQRAAIRTAVTRRSRTGTGVGAGAAIQGVDPGAAVVRRGRVRVRQRAVAAAKATAAWATVGRRCRVIGSLEATAAG
jgi:hypothetical protein